MQGTALIHFSQKIAKNFTKLMCLPILLIIVNFLGFNGELLSTFLIDPMFNNNFFADK